MNRNKPSFLKYLPIFFLLLSFKLTSAQIEIPKQKVLFVLDASGSMEALWGSETRMEIAKSTLLHLVDSLEQNNPNIEVGLRVFGHQFHKSQNNCKDSKLEVSFAKNNTLKFQEVLQEVKPNGHTPIAYSLVQTVTDFEESDAINSIILITDGLENCDGNPCDAAKFLNEKRISINPFIIGLDIEDSLVHQFSCIGSFINAKDPVTLNVILKNTIKKATGKTSLSIQLMTKDKQQITNTPIQIMDPISQKVLYTYIHTLSKKGLEDTLYIDPRGKYQVKVNCFPPISSSNFQLAPGSHNNIVVELPMSVLDFNHEVLYDDDKVRFLLRKGDQWVYNQEMQDLSLIQNSYNLTTSLLPLKNELIQVKAGKILEENIGTNGKLSIENNHLLRASIYATDNEKWLLAYDIGKIESDYSMKLQAGTYSLVYILESETNSDNTHHYDFKINENRTTVIQLN